MKFKSILNSKNSSSKQLAVNLIAHLISFITGFLISFFLTPYVVEKVSEEAYGFVGLANNFIGYATIVTTALNSMASRFITISIHRDDYDKTNRYFTSLIFANIAMSVPLSIAGVFIVVFINKFVNVSDAIITDVRILWALLFANFILGLIFNVFSVATFSRNRLDLSSLRSIEANILKVAVLLFMFAAFKPSVWYLGLSAFLCGIYIIITNVFYTKKLLPFVKIKRSYFDKKLIGELVSSGMWNSLSHLSSTLSTGLDLLVTNLFVSSVAMGTVSVSKTVPTQILSVFATISSIFMPQFTISYAKNDFQDIKNQIDRSMKLLGFFACIPMAFIYVFGKEFYQLWVPSQNASVLQNLTILASLAFPFVLSLEPLWNIFTVTNKVKQSSLFLLFNSVVSVLTVFLLLQFTNNETIKMYIVVGVSSAVGVIRGITFLPMYGAKCLNFKLTAFYSVILKNLLAIVITTALMFLFKSFFQVDSWLKLMIAAVITAVLSSVVNSFIVLGKPEREFLRSKIMHIIKK